MRQFVYDKGVITLRNEDGTTRTDTCVDFRTQEFTEPTRDIMGKNDFTFARSAKISSSVRSRLIGKVYKYIWTFAWTTRTTSEEFKKYVSFMEIILINLLKPNSTITTGNCDKIYSKGINGVTIKQWSKFLEKYKGNLHPNIINEALMVSSTTPFIKKLIEVKALSHNSPELASLIAVKDLEKCEKIVQSEFRQGQKIASVIEEIPAILEKANIPHYVINSIEVSTAGDVSTYDTIEEVYSNLAHTLRCWTYDKRYKVLKSVCAEADFDNIHNLREFNSFLENELHKDEQKLFVERQELMPTFEDNTYKVYIPKSYAECKEIGNYFHNCVGHFEWDNYLKRGERGLFIVVRKSDEVKVACCDCDEVRVLQKLQKYNNSITDKSVLDFIKEYEKELVK